MLLNFNLSSLSLLRTWEQKSSCLLATQDDDCLVNLGENRTNECEEGSVVPDCRRERERETSKGEALAFALQKTCYFHDKQTNKHLQVPAFYLFASYLKDVGT